MPIAKGSVRGNRDGTIIATFTLETGETVIYTGLASVPFPAFNVANLVITYVTPEDFTGSSPFTCNLGPGTNFAMTIGTNITMAGSLDQPVLVPLALTGIGKWGLEEASKCSCLAECRRSFCTEQTFH